MSEKDIKYFKDKWEMNRLLRATQQERYYAHQDLKEALIKLLSEIIQKIKRVEIENRKGIMEQFPMTTISVAVVEVDPSVFKSPLEIGEVGAQVKHRAKSIMGSAYVINRRKHM